MSASALAAKRNPGLMERGRGRVHWEVDDIPGEQLRGITHQGDQDALSLYLEQSREELQAEAARLRARAKELLETPAHSLPMLSKGWLSWLEAHEAEFHELLRTASTARS